MNFEYVMIFVGIIIAALLLYFGFTRFIKNKDLNQDISSTIDIMALLEALGGKDNIVNVKSSPSKLTVDVKNRDLIQITAIQELGASGIVEGQKGLSMIFGKQSALIEEDLKKFL